MNVFCPNCSTVYRVDPAKVPEGGVRARCAVCSAVFAVKAEVGRPAQPPAAPEQGAVAPIPPATERPTPREPISASRATPPAPAPIVGAPPAAVVVASAPPAAPAAQEPEPTPAPEPPPPP